MSLAPGNFSGSGTSTSYSPGDNACNDLSDHAGPIDALVSLTVIVTPPKNTATFTLAVSPGYTILCSTSIICATIICCCEYSIDIIGAITDIMSSDSIRYVDMYLGFDMSYVHPFWVYTVLASLFKVFVYICINMCIYLCIFVYICIYMCFSLF